jgi:hypothetical protein
MGEMWQFVDFPFPDDRFPSQLGAVIQRTVLEGQLPARYVAHTDDNSWIVGDSINDPNDEGAAVAAHIRHVVDRDPSLEQLATLPTGFQARRDSTNDPWQVEPFAWLPDNEPFISDDE